MPAADCELLVDGFLAQPVNSLSSLAFVLVGVWVAVLVRYHSGAQQRLALAVGGGLALVGIGSVAFHGPGGPTADWIHDGSITALLVLIIALELANRSGWSGRQMMTGWLVVAAALMVVEGIWPDVGDGLNAPLALFAVVGVIGPRSGFHRSQPRRTPERPGNGVATGLAMLAVGAIIMLLSRTDGPLCAPDSLVQGHAIWHLLAATGLGTYAVSAIRAADRGVTRSL